MDFKNAAELLAICEKEDCLISGAMRKRECALAECTPESVDARMKRVLKIMRESALYAAQNPAPSMGGLIGGESELVFRHWDSGKSICGDVMSRAMVYALSVMEVNASMGLIVAAPTAGSAGVVPGVLFALGETYQSGDDALVDALFNAGAVGYLAMRNATVAGAVGGCQAEVGVASAMAASAAVELMGGTPAQCLHAAAAVLMNMLGLVCDPIGGLVECPCQGRNAAGVSQALIAAELALAGVRQHLSFDEMLHVMYTVGRSMPVELRETALGGCAAAPSACGMMCKS